MNAKEIVEEITDETGWNEETILLLTQRFLDSKGEEILDEYKEYLLTVKQEETPTCCDCNSSDNVCSTPCGSLCGKCFIKHIKKCGICRSENEKLPLF